MKKLILLLLLATPAFAQLNQPTQGEKDYFTTKFITHSVVEETNSFDVTNPPPDSGGDLVPNSRVPLPSTQPIYSDDGYGSYGSYGGYGGYASSATAILDTALKIWNIVEKNRPVVTVASATYATALPKISENRWDTVGGWQKERNFTYTTDYVNGFGMNTIHVSYQVKVVYGGNVKGKGLFIAAARIVPISVKALWGYNLNVSVSAPVVFNVRTPEDPIAAIQLNVIYDIKTVLSEDITTDTYQVQGDGKIIDTKSDTVLKNATLK